MKYLLFYILIISSCSLFNDYSWIGIESIETIEEALLYMRENITYKLDYDDYWQFPEETYNIKSGDCEDMAALLAHLFIYNVNLSDVVLVGCIRKSDMQPHMVVKVGDQYYEATRPKAFERFYDIYYKVTVLSYENYIDIARLYHL